ncbi:MobV family relaxase, partial [Vibrio parahaemolyticus]|nr:MobV family relaxase [Vibrio parahaemolyticus]
MAAVEARLPEKRRKDAVLAIEYLVTASPEAMQGKSREQQDAYFADSLEWLKERHGAENVVYAGVHRDETTPHMYAYVVPLDRDTGRLNAKKWLGGSKALNQMQTEFADRIGQRHGLERGIERSKARHQTVRQFYANLDTADRHQIAVDPKQVEPRTLKKGIFTKEVESPEMV